MVLAEQKPGDFLRAFGGNLLTPIERLPRQTRILQRRIWLGGMLPSRSSLLPMRLVLVSALLRPRPNRMRITLQGLSLMNWRISTKLTKIQTSKLPHLPFSLCWQVPEASEATVLPKSRTAQLGCTLRSLTHHLAALAASGRRSAIELDGQPR